MMPAEEEDGNAENDEGESLSKVSGFILEFDAARKIAQGLGIHLEKSPSIVEVKGDKARLLPVAERTRYLFGKEAADVPSAKKRPKKKDVQLSLFEALNEADDDLSTARPELKAPKGGSTVLDRVHQAMILFAAGRSDALKRFVVDDGNGKDARFWKLAQSLSALYPPGIDEKRWVDGVLARKKGLGF
jgi:putative DNA methylase